MGLGLPRVALTAINNLAPCVVGASTTEQDKHVGLVVYNTQNAGGVCTGIYVWTGRAWTSISGEGATNLAVKQGDDYSNSFIIPKGTILEIPVKKAYTAWKTYPMLGTLDLTGGVVTTEIEWADHPNHVSTTLKGGDLGENSTIILSPPCSAVQDYGNAVVTVKVDGIVRWSWHIWTTDYDPDNGGQTYSYNNGVDNNVFMDRNLGVVSTNPNDGFLTLGTYYEWGRKDPFPRPKGLEQQLGPGTPAEELTLFGAKTTYNPVTADGDYVTNLKTAITEPFSYIGQSGWFHNDNSTYANEDADFWGGTSGTKGFYDPCPKGWKIPINSAGNVSPLAGLTDTDATFISVPTIAGNALDLSSKGLGLFTLTGARFNGGGAQIGAMQGSRKIGLDSELWIGTNEGTNSAVAMTFQYYPLGAGSITVQPESNTRKAYGNGVRCAKD